MKSLQVGLSDFHGRLTMLMRTQDGGLYQEAQKELLRLEKLAAPETVSLGDWAGEVVTRLNRYLRNTSSRKEVRLVTDGERLAITFFGVAVWDSEAMDCPESYAELEALVYVGLESMADSFSEAAGYFSPDRGRGHG